MKNTIKLIICLALIAGCKKEDEPIKYGWVTFYQYDYKGLLPRLYVDGKHIGVIYPVDYIPQCGAQVKDSVYTLELPYGSHEFWIQTGSGKFEQTHNVSHDCEQVKVKFN